VYKYVICNKLVENFYAKLALIYLVPLYTNNNDPLQYALPVCGDIDLDSGNTNELDGDIVSEPVILSDPDII
jgi:hypothetical protein